MAEADSKAINIPWTPLLALLAAVAGLTALLPSRSARPPATGAEVAVAGSRGVSARLWQDPLQVANEAEAQRKKEPNPKPPNDWTLLQEKFEALKRPLVLMMCVPDSPYAEDVERRLRDRAAMHYALSAEGYVPSQSTALNYVVVGEGPLQGYTVPFESFIPTPAAQQPAQKILAIWVGDSLLEGKPLEGVAGVILHLMRQGLWDLPPEVRILGPSTSGQYRKILKELEAPPTEVTKRLLSATKVYSCKASAAEAALGKGVGWLKPGDNTALAIEAALTKCGSTGFRFECTVAMDDQLYAALIGELKQRHLDLDASVVVLSELDSFYGRALVRTFRRSIYTAALKAANEKETLIPDIHAYTYMAGIDGALPKNALGVEERSEKDQGSGQEGNGSVREATEGQSQIDYFRRLANMLARENSQLIAEGGEGFRVVAVLGSDIYDKLQILRTLRPRLPGALFITNGLDARFGHPDEWDETRNLIVAANYPLSFGVEGGAPPFRDSTQVAVYAAARQALNPDLRPAEWNGRVRLFEIGRHGPVNLTVADKDGVGKRPLHWRSISIALLALFLLAFLLVRHKEDMPENVFHGWFGRLRWWLSRSAIVVPAAVIVSLAVTTLRYRVQTGSIEPFALYDGISIWPGDFLRLFAFLLAIHFVFKTLAGLDINTRKLEEDFGLKNNCNSASATTVSSGLLRVWWNKFWPHIVESSPPNAQALVNRYCAWGKPHLRFWRAFLLLVVYWVLIFSALHAFPSTLPYPPVRGDSSIVSLLILFLAGFSTLYVTFLVVDASTLNCLFIRDLNKGCTEWPLLVERSNPNPSRNSAGGWDDLHQPVKPSSETKSKFSRHLAVLEDEDAADYLDIQYIARRSNAVNALIYYPFILLALLIAARWSQTDGYPWPGMVIVVFILNASWAAYCAIRLPMEARRARDVNLRRLRKKLFKRRADEAINPDATKSKRSNSVALEAVISEIEKLRSGAFVGIWEQPLLRAILLPSGGLGIWALLDLLPR